MTKSHKRAPEMNLSRRSFLRGSTLATAASISMTDAVSALAAEVEAVDQGPAIMGPNALSTVLKINGVSRRAQVEPRTTLAEVLRENLGLMGTKVACNRGACSACTVWLDREPILSCTTLAIDVGSREVTTIEGLAAADGALHPVQEAFIAHDALQCGFCTPGMVMSCAALLARTASPNIEDVKEAISGHLCRCGSYPHVIAATLAAASVRRG